MGRVADSYGVRGWVKAAPGGGVAAEALAAAQEWWIGERVHRVTEARVHGANVIAKLDGVETREQARALRGAGIAVRRETLPEADDGRYYHADLIGLDVVNEQGERLGRIARLFSNGAQDVMALTGERERLIPWVAAIVKQVDLAAGQVVVQWSADW